MMDKQPLNRDQLAALIAQNFQRNWIVNLGFGIPTLASNFIDFDLGIMLTAENGLLGYGELAPSGYEDYDVVNASAQCVSLRPGAAIVQHADSFALIRKGLVNCTALGAYQVAQDGSFANWCAAAGPFMNLGGIGGAMDLAACSQQLFIAMEHVTKEAAPRLLERCTLPLTAPAGAVTLVVTSLGVFGFRDGQFELRQYAPGYTRRRSKRRPLQGC